MIARIVLPCGSDQADFTVIGKAPTVEECVRCPAGGFAHDQRKFVVCAEPAAAWRSRPASGYAARPPWRSPGSTPLRTAMSACTARVVAIALLLLIVTGCATGTVPGSASPGQSFAGSQTGGTFDVDVAVGECVAVGGSEDDATVEPAPCGSAAANFTVIGKVSKSDECIGDADSTVFQTNLFGFGEAGALCLDIDWRAGDCFELAADANVNRVDCAAPPGEGDRVLAGERIEGVADEAACPASAVVYPLRKVTVCIDPVDVTLGA